MSKGIKIPGTTLAWAVLLALVVAPFPVTASSSGEWVTRLDLRYRVETVDDDRFGRDATASTLRFRAGIVSPEHSGLSFSLAAHGNRAVFTENFNSTANGRTTYPVVADPDDQGISEAWVRYRLDGSFEVQAGRQRINEDNQRFIGAVGFRQLEQTFDALTARVSAGETRFEFRRIMRAHRVFGHSNPNPLLAEADLDAWTASAGHDFGTLRATLFAHRFAFDDRPGSHRNLGIRLAGSMIDDTVDWRIEFARQSGLRDLSAVSGQTYLHLRLAQRRTGWHWFAGLEQMGGDGVYAVQTPLATLHAHNGWTDQFLATPVDGLVDGYFAAGLRMGEWTGLFKFHHFRSDRGNNALGNEYGLMVARTLPAELRFEAKLAWFDGSRGGPSVLKTWWTLSRQW